MVTLRGMIKKTKLNQLLIPILLFANRIFYRRDVEIDVEEANKILNQFYKDSNSSCLRPVHKEVMISKYDIAIIIPCYKCMDTIQKCLDSCLQQKTRADFKIIAVDDGSPDNTGEILDDYVRKTDKLQVIHQENMGAGGARNTAINISRGKYIMFVDADDFLPEGSIENLFVTAEQKLAYIVQGNFSYVDSAGHIYRTDRTAGGVLNPLKDLKGYPWGKIYRSECFSKIHFPENYKYEDSVNRQIIYEIASIEKKIIYGIDQNVYCSWRQNPSNATNGDIGKSCSVDSFYITKALFNDRKKLGIPINDEYYDYILRMVLLSAKRIKNIPEEIKIAQFFSFREFVLTQFQGYHASRNMRYLEKTILDGDYYGFRLISQFM